MSVYSKRFLAGAGASGAISATVPAGRVWIVRDCDLVFAGSLPANAGFQGSDGQFVYYVEVAAGSTQLWYGWRGRQILNAGETLTYHSFAGVCDFAISGYELTSS